MHQDIANSYYPTTKLMIESKPFMLETTLRFEEDGLTKKTIQNSSQQ